MRTFFPEIEPYNSFYFPTGDGHELYVEEVGNPEGQPALFVHGVELGSLGAGELHHLGSNDFEAGLFEAR